jgi:S-DNA-T family DNA segregation ATPase FtsK/SpoIIIE
MQQLPACEAVGPDGTRIVIHPHATTDSVADLARALDLPVAMPLAIDDRPVAPTERLVATGLQVGSTVSAAPPADLRPSSRDGAGDAGVDVAIVVGPSCERWITLPAGRHCVGRATTAAVRIDDPAVELHHGILDVADDGTATFTQLTGAFPATIAGTPCRPAQPVDGVISIGNSRLVIGRDAVPAVVAAGSLARTDRDPWRRVVRRGPARPDVAAALSLEIPEPAASHRAPPLTTLVGAGVAALGAGVLAAVLGQLLFAVFAAVGALASLATWAVGAVATRRERRRSHADHRRAVAEFESTLDRARLAADRDHRVHHRSVVDALDRIHRTTGDLWSRRCANDESLCVTVGRGTSRWVPPIGADDRRRLDAELLVALERCERLDDVAVPLALEPSATIALHGPPAVTEALCRSMIVQAAADYGPVDWELQVVADDPGRWSWVSWLPHTRHRPCLVAAADATALAAAMDVTGDGDSPHRRRTVIVVDAPALLSARTSALRRRLDRGDATCIAVIAAEVSVPVIVDRILDIGDTGAARWIETSGAWTALDRDIVISGISTPTAEAAARQLAPLLDPEDDDGAAGIPSHVGLAELEPIDDATPTAIARRWRNAGRDPAPIACLGLSADGTVDIDLARDGPHGLIAGTTGSGKSELLRTLVVSLAAHASPDHVTMILIDFKGGSTFDACARLPHTVGVVTDLDDGLAERVLASLDAEVRRRERLLRAVRADDLSAYRRIAVHPLPRLVVIIDEFASLAKELPDFLDALVSIAQRGRSLGIHLVLATQRPAGVVTDDIRANTNLRIALRLQDRADAHDVVGDPAPAQFPLGAPGRAALRLGPDELVVFQTADSSHPALCRSTRLTVEPIDATGSPGVARAPLPDGPTALGSLVAAIDLAAGRIGTGDPHRPWIDPLPALVRPRDLDDDTAVGLLDDPAEQCRRPLAWAPSDGSLLLVGAVGSGTTTAAATVAQRCMRRAGPDALHLYVIDAQGDAVWSSFEAADHCGAVVRVTEAERLGRLLARLADEVDRRSTAATREALIVLVIDGIAAIRDSVGEVAHGDAARRLDRVLRDGPAVGVVAVITTDGRSPAGLAVPRSSTWVFHVDDSGIARTAGLRTPVASAGMPGRLRVVETGLEGQVVFDPEAWCEAAVVQASDGSVPATGATRRAVPVRVLPEVVDPDEFDAAVAAHAACSPGQRGGEPVELPIGIGADDLTPAMLRVPVGDHVFIGGGARTGRSTALRQVEWAWRRAHPAGCVVRLDRRRPIDGSVAALADGDDALLVVVDDAERVDDHDGTLAQLLVRPDATVAVAARLEAVRVAYGHWTRDVARSRCGMIMTAMGDIDGELLGATLPRRSMIAPRPGLAWIIDQGGHRLVQVAARMPP